MAHGGMLEHGIVFIEGFLREPLPLTLNTKTSLHYGGSDTGPSPRQTLTSEHSS